MSSSTGPSSVAGGRSSMFARSEKEKRRPSEAGDSGGLASGRGDAAQALAHREPDAAGQTRFDQLGPTGDDAEQVPRSQAGEQFVSTNGRRRALDEVEKCVVGLGVDDVLGHLGHGGVVERARGRSARRRCGLDAPSR